MNSSQSIANLAAALAKAQPLIEGAAKDKNNPAFRSKYADLASVTEAVSVISAHGLSYVQVSHDHDNAASVETIILHTSGEWLGCGPVSVPVTKGDAHGFGSALTYARRYSLSSAFGVVPEDDDGNAAAKARPIVSQATRPGDAEDIRSGPAHLEWEAQPLDIQNMLLDVAHRISSLLKKADVKGAYNEVELIDMELRPALASQLSPPERAMLKAEGKTREKKAA